MEVPKWVTAQKKMLRSLEPLLRGQALIKRLERESAMFGVHDFAREEESLQALTRATDVMGQTLNAQDALFDSVRREHERIERLNKENALFGIGDFAKCQEHFQAVTSATAELGATLKGQQAVLGNMNAMQELIKGVRASVEPAVSRYLAASEKIFLGMNFDALSQKHLLADSAILQAQETAESLTRSYENLVGSIRAPLDIIGLPEYTLPGATREIFVTGHSIKNLKQRDIVDDEEEASLVEDAEAEVSQCIEMLKKVNPAFERLYLGACDGVKSSSPDRVRHVFVSLRELWSHVLRELAPDEKVIKWLPVSNDEYLHKGKPTRRARLLYICRGIGHESLADFLDKDTKAFIEYIDIFQRVHELQPGMPDRELRSLMLRTDSWLMYILQIHNETN